MEGYTFYLEPDGQNVFAKSDEGMEGVGSVYTHKDSPCAYTGCSQDFLDGCMVIPEYAARKIHPNLFVYLDKD